MLDREISLGRFGDHRRARVGRDFLAALIGKQTTCVRELGGQRREEIRYGRFLRNEKVTTEEMLEEAGRATGERVEGRHVLVIQDTSELNFSGHSRRKRGFGTVGNGTDIGLFIHPQLVVDAETSGILGLAGATLINRTKRPSQHRRSRGLAEKESRRWLAGAQTAGQVASRAASITIVADRESDNYEEFAQRPANVDLLTRAAQDRALADGGRLFGFCAGLAEQARFEIEVPAKGKRAARRASVALAFGKVTIKRPRNGAERTLPPEVSLSVVDVREIDPPQGATPVHWCLLTSHAVCSLDEAHRIVAWYRMRWIIEQLFRTMKGQGFAIEQSQIVEATTLAKLAVATLIAATRVMQLVQGRDGSTGQSLSDAFAAEDEPLIEALVSRLEGTTEKLKNPYPRGSLARAAWAIGRLGGWSGYRGGGYKPAGPKTMYKGLVKFDAIKQGWALAALQVGPENV